MKPTLLFFVKNSMIVTVSFLIALTNCYAFRLTSFPLARRSRIHLSNEIISDTSPKAQLTSTPYSISRSELNECILKVLKINKFRQILWQQSFACFPFISSWRKVSQPKIQLNPPCLMAFGRLLTLEELLLLECQAIRFDAFCM